jgi:hypothetical protein
MMCWAIGILFIIAVLVAAFAFPDKGGDYSSRR